MDLGASVNYRASVVIAALMIWLPSRIVIQIPNVWTLVANEDRARAVMKDSFERADQ